MNKENETPRMDALLMTGTNAEQLCEALDRSRQLERELTAAKKEVEELKVWKNEDPRMLREQIRVGDLAFQRVHDENDSLRKACAEKDEVLQWVGSHEHATHGPCEFCLKINHALSNHAGEEYEHKSQLQSTKTELEGLRGKILSILGKETECLCFGKCSMQVVENYVCARCQIIAAIAAMTEEGK